MLKIGKLSLENFKSYYQPTQFDFSAVGPGLHFVTGVNQIEPELGANGTGKSSLFDGLRWVLYGSTSRGLRAGNVRSWDQKGPVAGQVEVFTGDEFPHVIKRTWGPNSLRMGRDVESLRDCTQEEIDGVLRLNETLFDLSILFGQFKTHFIDRKPSEKLAVFSEVLELDKWVGYSERAARRSQREAEKFNQVQLKLSRLEGQVQQAESSLEDATRQGADFATQQAALVESLREKAVDTAGRVEVAAGTVRRIEAKIAVAEQKLVEHKNSHKLTSDHLLHVQDELHGHAQEAQKIDSDIRHFENMLEEFNKTAAGGACPTCFQQVDQKHVANINRKLNKSIKGLDDEASSTVAVLEAIEAREAELLAEKSRIEELIFQANRAVTKAKEEYYAQSRSLMALENSAASVAAQLEQELKRANPYEGMAATLTEKIKASKVEIRTLETEASAIEARRAACEFWVRNFKRIRLGLIDSALRTLEIEVNNNLRALGLINWSVRFDVERETKSGTISHGFDCLIYSPKNSQAVPWEAWSGGESQRIRWATTLGMASLIGRKRGTAGAMQVLDEPSQHVTKEGIVDLLDALTVKAGSEKTPIWLVEHHALDYGAFATTTTVINTANGSIIECSNPRPVLVHSPTSAGKGNDGRKLKLTMRPKL